MILEACSHLYVRLGMLPDRDFVTSYIKLWDYVVIAAILIKNLSSSKVIIKTYVVNF